MKQHLTQPEWLIMETLWNNHPLFLSEIMEALKNKVSWSHTTFLTYLRKMVGEGYISFATIRGSRAYSPEVDRAKCVEDESRSLLTRMTDESAKLFVSNLIRESGLSRKDRDDLRGLIDALEESDEEDS